MTPSGTCIIIGLNLSFQDSSSRRYIFTPERKKYPNLLTDFSVLCFFSSFFFFSCLCCFDFLYHTWIYIICILYFLYFSAGDDYTAAHQQRKHSSFLWYHLNLRALCVFWVMPTPVPCTKWFPKGLLRDSTECAFLKESSLVGVVWNVFMYIMFIAILSSWVQVKWPLINAWCVMC